MPFRNQRRLSADEASLRPDDPLTRLKGIGPRTAEAFAAEGVRRVGDLLLHLPRRYEDRTRMTPLDASIAPGDWVLVRGRVTSVRIRRIPRRRLHIVDGLIDDACGQLKVVWFNVLNDACCLLLAVAAGCCCLLLAVCW